MLLVFTKSTLTIAFTTSLQMLPEISEWRGSIANYERVTELELDCLALVPVPAAVLVPVVPDPAPVNVPNHCTPSPKWIYIFFFIFNSKLYTIVNRGLYENDA
jgi:hypothetical protein